MRADAAPHSGSHHLAPRARGTLCPHTASVGCGTQRLSSRAPGAEPIGHDPLPERAAAIRTALRDGRQHPDRRPARDRLEGHLDVNVVEDARAFFAQQIRDIEPERELALQTAGIAEGRVDHDQWQLYGYKLMRGRYRVVFSYHYDGPDYDKPNVFHGRVVARPLYFTVE